MEKSSKYKNVCITKRDGKKCYTSRLTHKGKTYQNTTHDSEETAAKEVDRLRISLGLKPVNGFYSKVEK